VIPNSIFISRPIQDSGETLKTISAQGGRVIAESLVRFEAVTFEVPDFFEVIFFSSIRAADFFLQQGIPSSVQFACAGKETADKLKSQFQISCEFIAQHAGNPNESATEFLHWLGNRRVLFPKSEQSLNTYSSMVPRSQKWESIVYRTCSISKKITPCDLYIFSSPSNVQAFLSSNSISGNSKCIAWGSSTAQFLTDHDIHVFHQLQTGTLTELDVFLKDLLELN
jgi:uroporphyrinogen-III synthase